MGPRRVLWDNYRYFIPSWTRLWLPLIGIGILGTALTAIVIRKRDPLLSFACVIFLLPLAPAFIFLLLYPMDYAHDRYLYLPCLGFANHGLRWRAVYFTGKLPGYDLVGCDRINAGA